MSDCIVHLTLCTRLSCLLSICLTTFLKGFLKGEQVCMPEYPVFVDANYLGSNDPTIQRSND